MLNIITFLYQVIQSKSFFLLTSLSALCIKLYLFILLLKKSSNCKNTQLPWYMLIGVLLGSAVGDLSWIVKLSRELIIPEITYETCVLAIRIAWAALILQYQSLALFIESLTTKKFHLKTFHKITLILSNSFVLYFVYLAFFDSSLVDEFERTRAFADTGALGLPFEVKIMRYASMYLLPMVIFPSLYAAFKNIKHHNLPKILKRQLTILIKYLLSPFLFAEFIIAIHLNIKHLHIYEASLLSLSTILISCSIYYCIRKALDLRFLNFNDQLLAQQRTDFIENFKEILGQISRVSSCEELTQITQTFFKQAFSIPLKKTMLYIRDTTGTIKQKDPQDNKTPLEKHVELFFSGHSNEVCEFIRNSKILVYDELTFSHFYQQQQMYSDLIHFLDSINADIFLPIYNKSKIIGYIVIEKNAKKHLYTTADKDEMIILANYISTIINLLQHRNLDVLVQQEKELKEELFLKHQEINQYKETLDSFLKTNTKKDIGILFYKKGHFVFGSQSTHEMLQVDPNKHDGHPFTKALKEVGHLVETFKVPKTILAHHYDRKIMISGMLNIEKNNVILTVYQPEIADILKRKTSLLKNPQDWDYVLYLESTKVGQLIDQYVPCSSESVLYAKIQLLKCALGARATLIDAHPEDVTDIADLVHQAGMKESLYTITLKEPVKSEDIKHKLFGSNMLQTDEKPLLASLKRSTLLIENVDFLDFTSQEYLSEFIKSGNYIHTPSEKKETNFTRIVCSSFKPLLAQMQDGSFSYRLYSELKKSIITIPSLITMPEKDLGALIDGIASQLVQKDDFKSMLDLNETEKNKLITQRPASISELKKRIRSVLLAKSKKVNLEHDVVIAQPEPDQSVDNTIVQAARLGKKALKNKDIMTALWNKFNNQNQIALFLGVNRSSVNRRCKDYNLQ